MRNKEPVFGYNALNDTILKNLQSTMVNKKITSEEATKQYLVLPFLYALGFDVFDAESVIPEYKTDAFGVQKSERVDYLLKRENADWALVECKKYGSSLNNNMFIKQLYKYFASDNNSASIAILTNGRDYWFYSDFGRTNLMDLEPFLKIDVLTLDYRDLSVIMVALFSGAFRREGTNYKDIINEAIDKAYYVETILSTDGLYKSLVCTKKDDGTYLESVFWQIYNMVTGSIIYIEEEPACLTDCIGEYASYIRERYEEFNQRKEISLKDSSLIHYDNSSGDTYFEELFKMLLSKGEVYNLDDFYNMEDAKMTNKNVKTTNKNAKTTNKNVKYRFTDPILDVKETVKTIRDEKMAKGRYHGHSKYLWPALVLRNKGMDNYEIAEELSKGGDKVTKQQIQNMFDSYSIKSNDYKVRRKYHSADDCLLTEEEFNEIDLKSLITGNTPAQIMKDEYNGKFTNFTFTDKRALSKVWDASMKYYYSKVA